MQRPLRFPTLSHAERDRRWALARDFMDREGLDCLLVFGSERHGVPLYGNWFTDDRPGTRRLFPRQGEMVGLCWSTQVISAHLECLLRGEGSWIRDLRRGGEPTLDDLVAAMERPVHGAGAWNITPVVHTMNPMGYGGSVAIGIERQLPGIERYRGVTGMRRSHADLVLRPGMTFAFDPNAHFGKKRVNLGGTVVMTDGEPLELNSLCNRMARVPA